MLKNQEFKSVVKGYLGRRFISHLKFFLKHPFHYPMLHGHLDIGGWLGYDEAVSLYRLARSIKNPKPVVVEIGSWQGKSSVVLGKALLGTSASFFCIDPFTGEAVDPETASSTNATKLPLRQVFSHNIRKNKVENVVQVIENYSFKAVEGWTAPIDMLFIDGNHEYSAVRQDFDLWTPFLVAGGILVMDDVYWNRGTTFGPAQVARESIMESPDWEVLPQIGKHLIARRRTVRHAA
jgi:hypothetical protein